YTTLFRSIRAVAYAAKGETAKAREEQKLFREAAKKPAKDATFGNNKAADLFAVGDDMLEGEILVREGKMEAGIKALRSAVAKEDKLRYSEPPDWVGPGRHALGAFLLHDGQHAEAEAVYREDLPPWPGNGRARPGLLVSLEAQGKKTETAKVRARFDEVRPSGLKPRGPEGGAIWKAPQDADGRGPVAAPALRDRPQGRTPLSLRQAAPPPAGPRGA